MIRQPRQQGFSLIELLVAATIFTFIAAGVSSLFVSALDIQRRAIGIQKIQENALFVMESIAREVRVSKITSPNSTCNPPGAGTTTLVIDHPTNGIVTYKYSTTSGLGVITRDANGSGDQQITSGDVNFMKFAFCVSGAAADDIQARVTMPMTIQSLSGRPSTRSTVSLQTTVVSRDLSVDLSN